MIHTVLCADADQAARRALTEILRGAGFEVIEAQEGSDALRLAFEKRPALVVVAVGSPCIDGFEVAKRLKADPRTAFIPVLHTSSHSGDYAESLRSGAEAWLQSPVEGPLLMAVVTALIERVPGASAERQFVALIESIPDEVWLADTQGRFTLANPAALREFKIGTPTPVDVEELAKSLEVYRPDGSPRPVEEAPPLRALRGETVRNQEEIVRTPVHGELRYRQVSACPVRDGAGNIVGSVSVVRDITEGKRAEQAQRASEERYRTLFDTMTEGFALDEIICDEAGKPCDLRYLAVNPAFERQTGVKAEDILGKTVMELFPETEPVWIERCGKVALTGEPARFEEWFGPLQRWFEVSAFRTEPGRFGVVFADVTERKRAEEERRRLAGDLSAILDAAPVAIWIAHDPQCLRITGNAYADQVVMQTGRGANVSASALPGEEALSYKVFREGLALQPKELPNQVAAATGQPVKEEEFEMVFPDGRTVHLLLGAVPLFDAEGRVRGSVTAGVDVTPRKRAEEALRESEAVLRSFFDSPGMMRGFVELVGGAIVHASCNAAAAELFGVDRASIAGLSATAAGASEEVARLWVDLYEKSRRTGEPVSMEYARRGADGRDRWLLATASYVGIGHSGNPRFAYTVLDLTERKRAEEALRESEERFRIMADSCPTIILVTDADGGNRFVNRTYREYFGVTNEQVEGGKWQPLLHPDDAAGYVGALMVAVRERAPFQAEARVRRADGEWRWIASYGEPRFSPGGEFLGHSGICTDIDDRKQAEEALRESESRLRTLSDNLPECAIYRYRHDVNGEAHVDFISAGIERMTGVPAAEYMREAATVGRNIVPEDFERMTAAIALSRERLERFDMEVRHPHRATGEMRWSLLRSTPTRCPDGSTVWDGIELDITERKRAEEQVRQSEERYRLLFDTLIEGFCIIEVIFDGDVPVDYRFLETNPAFEAQTGLKNAKGRLIRELAPDNEAHWYQTYGRVALTGQPTRFVNEAKALNRWYDVSAYRIGGPESRRVAILFSDITEARRATEALRESESRERARAAEVEALMDAAPTAIFIAHDAECLSMTGNRTAHALLRREAGKNLSKSAPEGQRPMNFRAMKDGVEVPPQELPIQMAAATGQPVRGYELDIVFEDGVTVNLLGDAVPLLDEDGHSRGAVGVLSDVTELKRAEARLRDAQKLESLGLLAGGVAHDFNNLLVGVIGNASLAQEMLPPDHEAGELLAGVLKAGEQAAHLTRQMLAYAGKGKFVVEALDISALIPDMSVLVRPSIPKKTALQFGLEEKLPPILADRGQVQQVFMNLVLNAAEAIGNREGVITVRTGVENVNARYVRQHPAAVGLQPGRYVVLEVRDNGCGMDEATKARIFDPFFTTKFTGRGLGLAAVAGIVRGHKGAIVVTSAPGKGSSFTVLFPSAPRTDQEPAVAATEPAARGAGVVLIVDDEPIVLQMAKKALERQGYTVLLADSGQAAIELLRSRPGNDVAVVVLDQSMPNMNGEEVLPELRKLRPEVEVVMSSGFSESETMLLMKGQRVSGFIQKPYTAAGLAEKVKRCPR